MAYRISLVTAVLALWCTSARGEITNWQTGEAIPGTEGISPGPGLQLSDWDVDDHNLRFADFAGADLRGAQIMYSALDDARFTQADLTGAFFQGTVLTRADFSGANLRNAWLEDELVDADLTGANLTDATVNADLTGAVLNDATITGAELGWTLSKEQLYSTASYRNKNLRRLRFSAEDLQWWDFSGQDLSGGSFYRATLTNANLNGASVLGTSFSDTTARGFTPEQLYSTASYREKNLKGTNLSENDLTGWNFSSQDLSSAQLREATLAGANLAGANLTGAALYESGLAGTDFSDAVVTGASFSATTSRGFTPEQLYATVNYQNHDLRGIGLGGNDLTGWDFRDQDLSQASLGESTVTNTDFSGAIVAGAQFWSTTSRGFSPEQLYATASYQNKNLQGISLRNNDLTGWDFRNQNLSQANFGESTLTNADFSGATLDGAWFSDAMLTNADFSDAIVTGARFLNATSRGFTREQLYATASYQNKNLQRLFLRRNDLSAWDFRNQDLSRAFLDEATLANADLSGATVAGAWFSDTTSRGFTAEQLYATASYQQGNLQAIQLHENDLSNWDFRSQDLSQASFFEATLTNTDFSEAVVTGASFSDTTSRGFTPEQLYATASYQQRKLPGIGLGGNDLSGWNLERQDLSNSNFGASKLRDAKLAFADLSGAFLREANLDGANLEHADLAYANLRGATLTNVELAGTNLYGTDLRGARGFDPVESTLTRNSIWPDGTIRGLDVDTGEHLLLPSDEIFVTDGFTMTGNGTVEATLNYGWTLRYTRLDVARGIPIQLGGTLLVTTNKIPGAVGNTQTFHLFDWPGPLVGGNEFSTLELPAGAWDTSRLYTDGEIELLRVYQRDGDFDVDGQVGMADIDRLSAAVQAGRDGSYDYSYDTNRDNLLNHEDIRIWAEEFAETSLGDANLDGAVDFSDFLSLSASFGGSGKWRNGDFDGDGSVLFPDFLLLSAHFAKTVEPTASVPEPSCFHTAKLAMVGVLLMLRRRRQ